MCTIEGMGETRRSALSSILETHERRRHTKSYGRAMTEARRASDQLQGVVSTEKNQNTGQLQGFADIQQYGHPGGQSRRWEQGHCYSSQQWGPKPAGIES